LEHADPYEESKLINLLQAGITIILLPAKIGFGARRRGFRALTEINEIE
jgi:hypothetical protein